MRTRMIIVLLLAALAVPQLAGAADQAGDPSWPLDGVARRHPSLFEDHAGMSADRWYFRATWLDATHVLVPDWVAALAVESKVVQQGRWSGWLSDRAVEVRSDGTAVYRIVWQAGRQPASRPVGR